MAQFLTVREAAEKLACSQGVIRKMIKLGELRAFVSDSGKIVRVDPESILEKTGAGHVPGAVHA